jgi:hypothetical protein
MPASVGEFTVMVPVVIIHVGCIRETTGKPGVAVEFITADVE